MDAPSLSPLLTLTCSPMHARQAAASRSVEAREAADKAVRSGVSVCSGETDNKASSFPATDAGRLWFRFNTAGAHDTQVRMANLHSTIPAPRAHQHVATTPAPHTNTRPLQHLDHTSASTIPALLSSQKCSRRGGLYVVALLLTSRQKNLYSRDCCLRSKKLY